LQTKKEREKEREKKRETEISQGIQVSGTYLGINTALHRRIKFSQYRPHLSRTFQINVSSISDVGNDTLLSGEIKVSLQRDREMGQRLHESGDNKNIQISSVFSLCRSGSVPWNEGK